MIIWFSLWHNKKICHKSIYTFTQTILFKHFMICQVEIVDNLLKEEKQMKKRYQQQPQLWPEKQRDRVKVINVSLLLLMTKVMITMMPLKSV